MQTSKLSLVNKNNKCVSIFYSYYVRLNYKFNPKWKKSHTARTDLKSNRKIAETETKWIPLIYVYLTYDSSFNLLGTDTSINKVAGLNL
jgi:hypothetical protein